MLALQRSGRKAEALRSYATIRAQLVDELGVEPGADLRGMYESILADDAPAPAAPRQLPPDLPDFTGRADALAALAKPFQVAVVSGPPGVGKSALAVHAAHALRERFPAGQLYLDLDGREPAELLAEALRALGVEAAPPTPRERSALLRSLLAERPMLLLLDDALDAGQVRPLLPGNACSVIVTSRRRITELPGAVQIDLAEPPQDEALSLLDRHRADDVTDLLVDVNLLELVGTDPVGQPRYRLPDLIRHHALERGHDREALSRVLAAWTVTTEHAMARLPTTVFSLTAARAPRWRLPDQTLDRLTADPLGWFEAEHDSLAGAVAVAAEAGLAESAWGLAAAMVPYLDLHCRLDTWQRTHTLALAAARASGDTYGEAAMLRGLAQVALYQDRYDEAAGGFTRSRRLFHELGDVRAEATSICGLGAVSQFSGRQARSLGHFRRALAMFLAADDPHGEAFVRQAIGRVHLRAGELAQASESLRQAMRLAQELGDSHREGCVCLQMGNLHGAMSFHRHALDIFESLGDRHCGAYALQSMAGLQVTRGELAPASAALERSLEIFQELGDRSGAASTTQLLGELHRSAGRTVLARDYLKHASELRRDLPVRTSGA
ncbi:hypothetical protein GCM10012289_03720 [Nonomuraea cavernae]|uniref:AAA+ ATPase domain-containing protein n=1 Tax=Nonomuraea cavernae TaxID=2045107 RepID=A0A917YPK6_9ACTN|nr:hypothetical protein GCM10012289_03720 [Nonomuraea cavernae]